MELFDWILDLFMLQQKSGDSAKDYESHPFSCPDHASEDRNTTGTHTLDLLRTIQITIPGDIKTYHGAFETNITKYI